MAKNKKNAAAAAQVENVVVANEAVVENVVEAAETPQTEDKAAAAKAEAERLMAAAKEAAAAAKAAAKEAKEAAKKAKAFSSRPVRKSYFEVRVVDKMQDVVLEGEFVSKSDVHYCAEKTAIDCLASLREQFNYDEHVYYLFKVAKTDVQAASRRLISTLYLDEETNQIVID